LNYIDILFGKYKTNDDDKVLVLLKFIKLLLNNTNNKDIFSSFDHLSDLARDSLNTDIKTLVIEIYLIYTGFKKSLIDNYLDFSDYFGFVISLRSVLIDYLLHKYNNNQDFLNEVEKIFGNLIKDSKNEKFKAEELKDLLRATNRNTLGANLERLKIILESSFSKEEIIPKYSFINFFIIYSYLSSQDYQQLKQVTKFILVIINFTIFSSQRRNKTQLISEYYIEKYLKDVLEIITSDYDLDMKSYFLLSTIGFVNYFDGYESILFQNGLFHAILSDLTANKFERTELQVLSYEEAIDQDFFNAVLQFVHKTSSFKEIPVHFLNKTLELPRDNIYPYRIDNVIFSLKKKRTLDEITLNELIIPRLIYELNNFWVSEDELKYLNEKDRKPTNYERTNLIHKIFKILYSIFEHNTNSSNIRYYEGKLIDALDSFIKTVDKQTENNQVDNSRKYEPLYISCVEFISKICYFLPDKVPSILELRSLHSIFSYFKKKIPLQPNIINLIFNLIYAIHLNNEGIKFLQEEAKGLFDNLFEAIFKEEYYSSNIFTPTNFINEDFFTPFTMFLRVENINEILVYFFEKVLMSINRLNANLNEIRFNKHHSITREQFLEMKEVSNEDSLTNNHTFLNSLNYQYSYTIHLIAQFFMNMNPEDVEILNKDNMVKLEDIILAYVELIFNPLTLYSLSSNVISTTMIKTIFQNNAEKLLTVVLDLIDQTLNIVNFNTDMIVDDGISDLLSEKHKDKILSKMIVIFEFIVRKVYNILKDKSMLDKMMARLTLVMVLLIKKQSNINIYMSPVNDCILIINQKYFLKYLSTRLNPNLRALLISNTKVNRFNAEIEIFNENTALELECSQKPNENIRVEIVESNSYLTNDIIDHFSKVVINSHMPVLDLFITLGKSSKKLLKDFNESDISSIKNYRTLAYLLNLLIQSMDLGNNFEMIREWVNSDYKGNMNKIIDIFIFYINIVNNINIVLLDKNINGLVVFNFIKLGGLENIFNVCLFLLNFSDLIYNKGSHPLLLFLLIKNLWNIITSVVLRIVRTNTELFSNYAIILLKEGFESTTEYNTYIRYHVIRLMNSYFINNKDMPLNKITSLSYSMISLIYSTLDICMIHFKNIKDSKDNEDELEENKLIEGLVQAGFNKVDIISAMQDGYKTPEEIINVILAEGYSSNRDQNLFDAITSDGFDESWVPLKNEFIKYCRKDIFGTNLLSSEKPSMQNVEALMGEVYHALLEDDYNSVSKIMQIRKMNLIFRIKDLTYNNSALMQELLIPFIKEISIMERENFIELQNSQNIQQGLNKLLQNRMLINYIIIKDRSKVSNIFESLNFDEVAEFFNEFKVIENSLMTLSYLINLLKSGNTTISNLNTIIYESLFLINLAFQFIIYYQRMKEDEKKDFIKFNNEKYIKDYMERFTDLLELQLKLPEQAILDEQNLIIIFSTIVEAPDNEENIGNFVLKGGLKNLIKLKRQEEFKNFNDTKFKYKVILDEAFRMFIFRIFEDTKQEEAVIESIIKYLFANYYNTKSEPTYTDAFKDKMNVDEEAKDNKEAKADGDKIEEEKEQPNTSVNNIEPNNTESNNNIPKQLKTPNKNLNVTKSLDTQDTNNLVIEMNFDDFYTITYPLIPKNRELFLRVLKRLCQVDKRAEKQLKKGRKKINLTETILTIKLLPEYNSQVLQIAHELTSNTYKEAENKDKETKEIPRENRTNNIEMSGKKTKESRGKITEGQIDKLAKTYSNVKTKILNTLINQIWELTGDVEKEIDKNTQAIQNNTADFNLEQKYIFDIDTILIALANLVNSYPNCISLIIGFHKNVGQANENKKDSVSFISFLVRNVFHIMNYFKMSTNTKDNTDTVIKDKDNFKKKLTFEANSNLSVFEAYRNYNIISYFLHALCYRRRNMSSNDIFLVNTVRRKIIKELDSLLKDLSKVTMTNNLKQNINYKTALFLLFSLTEFHDNSHVYSQLNPFELVKMLAGKDYEIIKNLTQIMKGLSLSNPLTFTLHKLSTLLLAELTKYIRINPKMKGAHTESKMSPGFMLKSVTHNADWDDLILEANIMGNDESPEEDDEDDEEEDIEMQDLNEDIGEDDELEEGEDSEELGSEQDFYYSISSSEEGGSFNDEDMERSDSFEEDEDGQHLDFHQMGDEEEEKQDEGEEPDEEDNFEEDEDFSADDDYMINQDLPNEISVQFNDENGILGEDRGDSQSESLEDVSDNYINVGNFRNIGRHNGFSNIILDRNNYPRLNINFPSILLNGNNNHHIEGSDDYADEVLFINPMLDKNAKGENNIYFEENIIFPFMIYLINDDLYELYKPGVYISVINKIKKRQIDVVGSVYQYRYICPFDIRSRRNLYFAVNGVKEKLVNAYFKEFSKIEIDFITFSTGDQFKAFLSKVDSQENVKLKLYEALGIDVNDLKKKEVEVDNTEKKTEDKNNIENNEHKISVLAEGEDNGGQEQPKDNNADNNEIREEAKDNAEENQNIPEDNKVKEEDLIDPEFLEHIPQELREEVIQSQRVQQNNNNTVNQYFDPNDIDPEILNELPPELISELGIGIRMGDTNMIIPQVPSGFNLDPGTFLQSLNPELREEILLNSSHEFLISLPPELVAEAQRLLERDSTYRRTLLNIHTPPPEGSNIQGLLSNKEAKKFHFKPPKYNFEDILSSQKHPKDFSNNLLSYFDDDFIENLVCCNIKVSCETVPKTKIHYNQYWLLITNLIQNTNLRYKILDLLFVIWILDRICLQKVLRESPDLVKSNSILRMLNEIFFENKLLEEFFYDDFEQFIKNFCIVYQKEMKKVFLETNYTDKGEYMKTVPEESGRKNDKLKKYSVTKNSMNIKELLNINFEKDENVLSNLLRLMIINSKSDIKKIFALKIFTNIVTNCLKTDTNIFNQISKRKSNKTDNSANSLKISKRTIEMLIEMYYNFETILLINKEKKSNNPTQLLSEMMNDQKCFVLLLEVLKDHIKSLNLQISEEMQNFFTNKKTDIKEYSKTLPENVLFRMIKLVNQINQVISKNTQEDDEEEDGDSNKPKSKKNDKQKIELIEFIKVVNGQLKMVWENLDMLLYEVSKIMKEDQKIIDPKLNRLIPYLEAFITLSHLQFLPEKSQNMVNTFIMEEAYKRTPRRTPQYNNIMNSENIQDINFNEFFYRFCDKNKKVINLILRRYPKMFPNELLIKISNFLDLENKKKYFRYELKKLKAERNYHITLNVRRDHIFMDSYHQLKNRKPEELRGKLTIKFMGEEAVDAGGVKREWFTLLSKELFNPNFMLFKLAANGSTYMPNSESGMFESDHLQIFTFIGRVIAKAIYDGFMLECYFTRSFYKLICGASLTYHDMEDVDPEYYKNLKWLLETDISDMGEFLTFSYDEDRFGQTETIDLIENGRNVYVTEENKFEYVQKICYAKLFEHIKPQIEAVQKGIYEIIPLKLISIFDHREVELVISGLPSIDSNICF
jgi:hypothetical protein